MASVTVQARNCMHADAWGTALLVAGPDEGLAMAQHMGLDCCSCCAVMKAWSSWDLAGLAGRDLQH